jgi:hypothetical protein
MALAASDPVAAAGQAFPDAAIWDRLGSTLVVSDLKTGAYHATHPAAVTSLVGRPFRITGFLLPLETGQRTTHFILTRYPGSCPFCDPDNPNQVVEVYTIKPVRNLEVEVTVTGVFSLQNNESAGLFFRLDKADPS